MVGACNKNGYYYAFAAHDLAAGPVWSIHIGSYPGSCIASAVWDSVNGQLIIGGNATTVDTISYAGSLRAVNLATGATIWKFGIPEGAVMGSPSMNGNGIVAAATYDPTSTGNALYLVDAESGAVVRSISLHSAEFAQPVFADPYLFSTTTKGGIKAYTAPP
jgi:outer membrane protein assembly factor BamB